MSRLCTCECRSVATMSGTTRICTTQNTQREKERRAGKHDYHVSGRASSTPVQANHSDREEQVLSCEVSFCPTKPAKPTRVLDLYSSIG